MVGRFCLAQCPTREPSEEPEFVGGSKVIARERLTENVDGQLPLAEVVASHLDAELFRTPDRLNRVRHSKGRLFTSRSTPEMQPIPDVIRGMATCIVAGGTGADSGAVGAAASSSRRDEDRGQNAGIIWRLDPPRATKAKEHRPQVGPCRPWATYWKDYLTVERPWSLSWYRGT